MRHADREIATPHAGAVHGQGLNDYIVKDISLAAFGRKEIDLAETEMPGLMARARGVCAKQCRSRARASPLAAHDHPDRCADRDAEGAGSDIPGCRATSYSTQDHAAAAIAAAGIPVFATRRDAGEYWEYTARISTGHGGGTPNMILDDGGDATMLVHYGLKAEQGDVAFLDKPGSDEEVIFFALIRKI